MGSDLTLNLIDSIGCGCVFYGGYDSLKEAEEDIIERKREIDIGTVITLKNDNIYVWTSGWEPIGNIPTDDLNKEEIEEGNTLEKTTCSSCGAPLKISGHKGNIKCEYCGSTYFWR